MFRFAKYFFGAGVLLALTLTGCGRSGMLESGDLLSIRILPDDPQMYIGQIVQLRVEGVFFERTPDGPDQQVRDITDEIGLSFRVSQPGVVSMLADQRLIAREAGSARLLADFEGRQDSIMVDVSYAVLSGIDAQPDGVNLEPSDYQQLTVYGNLSDGTQIDLTQAAMGTGYSSDDQSVASVTVDGMVFGLSGGDTNVRVTHGDFSDTVAVTVGGGRQLVGLDVYPGLVELATGETAQLQVIGNYDDGSTVNLTSSAGTSYLSSDPGVASVGLSGLVTAVGTGQTSVTASYGSLSAAATVRVSSTPRLVSIKIEPASAQLQIGEQIQLRVTAFYSDSTSADVTSQSSYQSDDPSLAAVSISGLVTAKAPGSTSIRASFEAQTAVCSVEVATADLVSVTVEPSTLRLDVGQTAQLAVIASYSDGSQQDVTGLASYESLDQSVAAVGSGGLVRAVASGSTTVRASFGGLFGSCSVAVGGVGLVSIEIVPASLELEIGQSAALSVRAHYSDGHTQNVTAQSTFLSSAPAIATVQPGGQVLAVMPGSATISAGYASLEATCAVRVNSPVLVSIEISPKTAELQVGDTLQFIVTGYYSDGSSRDMTAPETGTTYQSSDPSVLLVIYTGEAIAQAAGGPVTVTARLAGFSDSATVMVGGLEPPSVTTLSPDSGPQGSTLRVIFYGSGLLGCQISCDNPGISVSNISYTPDGTQLGATFKIAAGAATGVGEVLVSSMAGSAATGFEVLASQQLEDLVIEGPGVVYLEGAQAYHDITIGTGAKVYGTGYVPLQFLASGNVTVNGQIIVSGHAGINGYYDPADGGQAGPGGGGGGGGADGDSATPSSGGAGSPPGDGGGPAAGAGTPSGAGGGAGAGSGISGGCGQAGGGGAFGGDGGSGGGDSGSGNGGAGGTANTQGSDYNGGSGGGGGSTCGPNSGGGGGGGGGVLVISALAGGSVTVRGALAADGGSGGSGLAGTGGGGGGSGGRIVVTSAGGSIVIEDTLSARGGDGGPAYRSDGGGGGGGGRIIIDAGGGSVDDSLGYYDVYGGSGGVALDPQPDQPGYDGRPGSPGVVDVRP